MNQAEQGMNQAEQGMNQAEQGMAQALYIGRFQPLHLGHAHCIRYALDKEDTLCIMVGSANKSRTQKNPFTADERLEMVKRFLKSKGLEKRCLVRPVPDFDKDDDTWFSTVMDTFPGVGRLYSNNPRTTRIFTHKGLGVRSIPFLNRRKLSGTYIRSHPEETEHLVPDCCRTFLKKLN